MRRLKCRALNKGNFVYGCYVTDDEDYYAIVSPLNKNEMKNTPVCEYSVQQYAGYQDSKDNVIFEGDIVNVLDYGVMEVIFSENILAWSLISKHLGGCLLSDIDNSRLTIIGNIHENPELLE